MAQKSNLTIEVLSIIGGILTAIFFLGFLALASILRSEISCLITGSIINHYYFDYQSPPDQAFSGCDEYHSATSPDVH